MATAPLFDLDRPGSVAPHRQAKGSSDSHFLLPSRVMASARLRMGRGNGGPMWQSGSFTLRKGSQSAATRGPIVRPRPPPSARAFDFAASQADVGEGAIVEPLERANVAAAAPFEHQPVGQPDAAPAENAQPLREPVRSVTRK